MLKIFINGINGKMGKEVANLVKQKENMHLLGGYDRKITHNTSYKVFSDLKQLFEKPDVIIDFSVPKATLFMLDYARENNIPMVIATTGFTKDEENIIDDYSKYIPIFKSSNMSFEINLMANIVSEVSKKLDDADIEIVETHHNQKIDSPSGTALMLANAINKANNNKYTYNFDRQSKKEKRNSNEIGFSSIRGGNVVGEHSVFFFKGNEVLEIKHTSYSREIFAEGSIKAAEFIVSKKSGMYSNID